MRLSGVDMNMMSLDEAASSAFINIFPSNSLYSRLPSSLRRPRSCTRRSPSASTAPTGRPPPLRFRLRGGPGDGSDLRAVHAWEAARCGPGPRPRRASFVPAIDGTLDRERSRFLSNVVAPLVEAFPYGAGIEEAPAEGNAVDVLAELSRYALLVVVGSRGRGFTGSSGLHEPAGRRPEGATPRSSSSTSARPVPTAEPPHRHRIDGASKA